MSDPIADLITRMRNGARAKHRFVEVPHSKMKLAVAKLLEETGFVQGILVKEQEGKGTIRIYLQYRGSHPVLQDIQKVSKPGCRKYVNVDQIPQFYGGFGISILSTSKGLMTGEKARQENVGGELLCKIW